MHAMQNTSLKGLHLELLVQSLGQHHPVRGKKGILLNEGFKGCLCSILDGCLVPQTLHLSHF